MGTDFKYQYAHTWYQQLASVFNMWTRYHLLWLGFKVIYKVKTIGKEWLLFSMSFIFKVMICQNEWISSNF